MKLNSWSYAFFAIIMSLSTESSALKCYRCISISCPGSRALCDQVKNYVLQQLPQLYYFYDSKPPTCPDPIDQDDDWERLKSQSATPCGEDGDGEATCALGRFQVTTTVTGVGNVTSYGTSLGCAKRKLLEYTKAATLRRECSIVTSRSVKRDSLTHFFEIEHCSVISDMCLGQDYCIAPRSSVVKTFRDGDQGGSSVSPLFIIVVVVLVIAFLALVLTVLGIKFN